MDAPSRSRWILKKLARRTFAAAGALPAWAAPAAGRVRVLTYHRFGRVPYDPFCLPPEDFERQVAWIAERGLAVSEAALLGFLSGERELPDGALLVTIDDGHRSTWTTARPVLRAHGVPAIAFVSAGLVGAPGTPAGAPEPYMGWDEVAALPEAGIAVGSHAVSHRSLGRLPPDEAREEVARSREILESRVDGPVRAFAYPFGTRADYDDAVVRAVGEAGYELAFTSQHGAVRRGQDALALPRVKIESGEGLGWFALACRGALDGWRFVDGALWRLQQRRQETPAPR